MRFAYADPPYPGMAARYGRREVNHERLIKALCRFDAWALSTSTSALRDVLSLCPPETRIASWCKSWCSWKPGTWPKWTWEPVLFVPRRPEDWRTRRDCPRDYLVCAAPNVGFFGSKPPQFCGWLFEMLGAEPEDDFHDLFKGSGAVTKSWKDWCRSKRCAGPLFMSTVSEARKPTEEKGDG